MKKYLLIFLTFLSFSSLSQGLMSSVEAEGNTVIISPQDVRTKSAGNLPVIALKNKRLSLDTLLKLTSKGVSALIVNKADLSYVNTQLSTMTTTAQVNAILLPKIDSVRAKALLQLKADVTALNSKVDISVFNNALSAKANTADLALKENTSDVNAKLGFKVNNTLFADTATALRGSINTKASVSSVNLKADLTYTNQKLHTVATKTALASFLDSDFSYFDGSFWEKKSGNVVSNGGTSAGTIIRVDANSYWKRKTENDITTTYFGTLSDGTTDNTANVQNAINSLPVNGGTVYVPENTKFYLSRLTFPRKCVLKYFGGSDLSLKLVAIGVNEMITHIANADNDGIVNEQRIEANFNPGIVINVRKDLNNHPFLGVGQDFKIPVRASLLIQDEGYEKFMIQHQNFGEKGILNGVYMYNTFHLIELTNIKNSSFATLPTVGNLITGNTSGAKGIVTAIDGTKTTVNWIEKAFVTGETVTCNSGTLTTPINEVSNTSITSTAINYKNGNPLVFNNDNGYAGIGLLPGLAKSPLTVGGRVAIQQSRSFGQYLPETITNPSLAFVDSYENTTPNGYEIYYNTIATNKRLELKKLNSSTAFGEIGAVKAHTSFANDVNFSTTSYNILSVVRVSTGQYDINFKVPFTRADFQISLTNGSPLDTSCRYAQNANTLTIRNYATGTTALQDLLAPVDLIVTGGDF